MRTLVFLLEEASMKAFLGELLPRMLPSDVTWKLVAHEGKSDLEQSIPRKLRAWRTPATRFVVIRDQDAGDCQAIKQRLAALCAEAGRPDTLVRIACRELEAYYLGAPAQLAAASGDDGWVERARGARFRDPDSVVRPSEVVLASAPDHGKVSLGRAMGRTIPLDDTRSHSFRALLDGVRRVVEEPWTATT